MTKFLEERWTSHLAILGNNKCEKGNQECAKSGQVITLKNALLWIVRNFMKRLLFWE